MKFSIGDIITGNEKSDRKYGITNSGAIMFVKSVYGKEIGVYAIRIHGEAYFGTFSELDEDCFTKLDDANIPKNILKLSKLKCDDSRHQLSTNSNIEAIKVAFRYYPKLTTKYIKEKISFEKFNDVLKNDGIYLYEGHKMLKTGDFVTGTVESDMKYAVTNRSMRVGLVTLNKFDTNSMYVMIIEHKKSICIGQEYEVNPMFFKKIKVENEEELKMSERVKEMNKILVDSDRLSSTNNKLISFMKVETCSDFSRYIFGELNLEKLLKYFSENGYRVYREN